MTENRSIRLVGNLLAAFWIFGGALFFFCRFTSVFYQANRAAIDGLFERMGQLFR